MKPFRDSEDNIKIVFNSAESASYQECPLSFLFMLSRYKFASKLIESNNNVLDVGCGQGIGSVMLSGFSKSIIGIDIDGELIEYCRNTYKINNLSFEVHDIRNPYNNEFGTIVCMDVLEHFNENDGKIVIKNLSNILEDNGILIIGTPNIESSKYGTERRKVQHLYEYSYDKFKEVLSHNFKRSMIFSMTDEIISTGFSPMAWYFMAVAIK